jgi:hypothetical protein
MMTSTGSPRIIDVVVEILTPSLIQTQTSEEFESICRQACLDMESSSSINTSSAAFKCVAVGLLPVELQVLLHLPVAERGIGIVKERYLSA